MSITTKTPLCIIQRYTFRFSKVWDVLDQMRLDPALNNQWNSICYLPCAAAQAFLHNPRYGNLSNMDAVRLCAELTGLYIWRKDKIIYRLNHELAEVLLEQARSMDYGSELPVEFLIHLPHDCMYIQTDIIEGADGFFVWVEFDVNRQEFELRIQLVSNDFANTVPLFLHLSGKTLKDCVRAGEEQTKRGAKMYHFLASAYDERLEPFELNCIDEYSKNQEIQLFAVQVILYLISENKEVELNQEQARVYRPIVKGAKIRDKYREIDIEDVGIRIGATLRKYKQKSPGKKAADASSVNFHSPKRPHIRRGHWHHYWSGKKDGSEQRVLKLNWVAPTMVREDLRNADKEENIVTIFPVE